MRRRKEREQQLPVTADKPPVAPSVVPGVPVPTKLSSKLGDYAEPVHPAKSAGGAGGTPQHMHAAALPSPPIHGQNSEQGGDQQPHVSPYALYNSAVYTPQNVQQVQPSAAPARTMLPPVGAPQQRLYTNQHMNAVVQLPTV